MTMGSGMLVLRMGSGMLVLMMLVGPTASTEDCHGIASKLNAGLMSRRRFESGTLEDWMAENGVLVNMCTVESDLLGACDEPMGHMSGSFMNGETGFRLVPTPLGNVVDPKRVKVKCAYPTDASTDVRDDDGCGPYKISDGSESYAMASSAEREAVRDKIDDAYLALNATNWTEVPCSALYETVTGASAITDLSQDMPTTYFEELSSYYAPFLGHPSCVDDNPPCVHEGTCGYPLNWLGPQSWPPSEFSDVLDLQTQLHTRFPIPMERGWNEVVLDVETAPFVAVFWINASFGLPTTDLRETARNRADVLNLPLLVVNLARDPLWSPLNDAATWRYFPATPWPSDNSDLLPIFSCDTRDPILPDRPSSDESPSSESSSSSSSSSTKKKSTTAFPWWGIALLFVAVALGLAFASYAYWRNSQRAHMRNQVRDILAGYMPLEDDDDEVYSTEMHPTSTKVLADLASYGD